MHLLLRGEVALYLPTLAEPEADAPCWRLPANTARGVATGEHSGMGGGKRGGGGEGGGGAGGGGAAARRSRLGEGRGDNQRTAPLGEMAARVGDASGAIARLIGAEGLEGEVARTSALTSAASTQA